MLQVYSVRAPSLIKVSSCGRGLHFVDIGRVWRNRLLREQKASIAQLEYLSFEPVAGSPRCYKVSVRLHAWSTPFRGGSATFCVPGDL